MRFDWLFVEILALAGDSRDRSCEDSQYKKMNEAFYFLMGW